MNRITFPLKFQMRGTAVADLQDGLLLLLDKSRFQMSEADRQAFIKRLRVERADSFYSDATRKLVGIFQEQNRIQPTGDVDERTAAALNAILKELGAFDPQPAPAVELRRAVSGRVTRSDGQPLASATVRAFHFNASTDGRGAVRLGQDITDSDGLYTIRYDPLPGASGVNLSVAVLDESGKTAQTSEVVRDAKPLTVIDLVVPSVEAPAATRLVEGRVLFDHGLPAAGVTLRLYRLGFGGVEGETLLKETRTREHGLYSLPYDPGGKPANIELRVVDAAGKETPLSKAVLGADEKEVLNLVAPTAAKPLEAEFTRLASNLQPHVGDLNRLASARENADRQDLTLLHEASGWDARLIALAATATKLSAANETGLPSDALYGLLRAGLPSDKQQLARVSGEAFDLAMSKARKAGIVNLSDQQAAQAKTAFDNFKVTTRLAAQAPGSRATYGDMLKRLDLSDSDQKKFAALYLNHRGDAAELWRKANEAGLSAIVPRLQTQGKLAFLTVNNPALTAQLQNELGNGGPAQLVDKDLYDKQAWKTRINTMTGNDPQRLAAFIPPAYADAENPLDAYADDMARKVRVSFPTQVMGRMIEKGEMPLEVGQPAAVGAFFRNAAAKDFKLGQSPVDQFVKANPGVFDGVAADQRAAVTESVKTLHRVQQITPSNEAMQVLMKEGLTSAQDIVAFPFEAFLDRYAHLFPSREQAELVYRKAEQVSNVTYNLFTIASELDSAPPVFATSPSAEARASAKNELIKHFPTMENLFGSLDFCECEHCRTVLSPAAYFVDLLQFLDTEPKVWANTMKIWEKEHGGAPYPFKNPVAFNAFLTKWRNDHPGAPDPDTKKTPYQIMIERRPDLPNIQLTCENTNTALPHIDIVNEILEYYVANNTLKADAARDTGDATTAELLAEPQNILPAAYDALLKARYPLTLPFDLWLETVRQFCDYFETPLWQVLETFRASDALFAPAQTYDRAAVFAESLGLSPAEYAIFTNPNPLPTWFELYGYKSENEATTIAVDADSGQRMDLNSAKALSRRLGVSYKELVEIVRSGFVNPKLEALVVLRKLGIETSDVFFYTQHAHLLAEDESKMSNEDKQRLAEVKAFEQRLDTFTKQYEAASFNARTWLQTAIDDKAFDGVLVLADTDASCNFDKTTFQYANGDKAVAMDFLRINLFVRLWRKLGWSIEETDRALQAFTPKNAPFDQANLNKAPLKTALIYLAHLKSLESHLRAGRNARLKLLTLWTPLPVTGANPLYTQLFLTRSALKTDAVFDHPLGQYLTQAGLLIKDHLLALQSALGLTADEVDRILKEDGQQTATAPLTLGNVSLLYRYGLLAKALKLSVADLIALKQLSGLDPFKPLGAEPLAQLEDDHPFTQSLRFVEVAAMVRDSGLNAADLDYLLRHRFDPAGKYRPGAEAMLTLTKSLAEGIRNIRVEHAAPADPGAMSDDALRQKLGLALPPDVVEKLFAMMAGTVEFTATLSGVAPAGKLDPAAFAGSDVIRQVSYNETRQEQKLTARGVLFDAQKNQLKAQFPGDTVSKLLDAAQAQARAFFDKNLLRQPLNPAATTGFLEAADFAKLFEPIPAIGDELTEDQKKAARKANEEKMREKRARLTATFLPFLQQRLIRQLVAQTMTAATGADAALIEALVTDSKLLADPAQNTKSLLDAFTATGERGVSATFFASADGGDPALASLVFADVDTALKGGDGNQLKPPGANSARFEGYLEVPAPGAYRFHIVLDKKDAEAELRFAHLPEPLLRGVASSDNAEISEFLELKPGAPYRFTLELRKLNGGDARLLVQGETMPKDSLARLTLSAESVVERSRRAQTLLTKALRLIQALGLNERELRHILANPADFDGASLSALPTRESDDAPGKAATLFKQFLRLAAYARLKNDLAGGGDDLISVFEAKTLDDVYALVAQTTRREKDAVKAAAEALFAAPSFTNEQTLERLWQALQVVETFGAPVASIVEWTKIASAAANAGERFRIARDLKDSVKARFEPDAWQRVAQPIFDKLRQRQRDALAAHVMSQHGFDRLEQLFEYFLIDPGMEPVVQTSRIRAAIASAQIFIQRCLLNLEPQVQPSVINSKHWQWMKRYRVWEANRKIFLFPENWLEPEFRDDKTHLFRELEGALLQGDVSNDLVEDAFFGYLKKLEALARLDIVGMYCEENDDPASNQLHVIGRTYNDPHKYFYRRYAHQMWTPWEPVTAEIEGNHIAPVVWRDRLNLFWVTFLEKADPDAGPSDGNFALTADVVKVTGTAKASQAIGGSKSNSSQKLVDMSLGGLASVVRSAASKKIVDVQLHWSEYFQGEWSTRESGGFSASLSASVPFDFNSDSVFIHASKEFENGEERAALVHLGGAINRAFRVVSRNSRPERASRQSPPLMPYNAPGVQANRYTGAGAFKVTFAQRIETEDGKAPKTTMATPSILQQGGAFTLLPCANAIALGGDEIASLVTPVFYQDNLAQTFFVEPALKEKTIEEWQEWVTRTPEPEVEWDAPNWWKELRIEPMIPKYKIPKPIDPGNPVWQNEIDPRARFDLTSRQDWIANQSTVVQFDGELIGPRGRAGLAVLPSAEAGAADGAASINVNAGSALAPGSAIVATQKNALESAGLNQAAGGLNVIGGGGLNSALLKNVSLGAGKAGGGTINR